MADRRLPVFVGSAQMVEREADPAKALQPIEMLERIAREAAADAGAADRVLADADTLCVVEVAGWYPRNIPQMLAERLGAAPARQYVTGIGGELPLTAVNQIADEVVAGVTRVALIVGCNNLKTLERARKARLKLDWATGGSGEPTMIGSRRHGSSEIEKVHGLATPSTVYPIFENALRARRKLDLAAHRSRVGALMSRFTEVASRSPYAWYPTVRSPEELTTPAATNRMIAFPYTKYLNAVITTDQAAGVLLLSADAARSYGIPEERWVHWRGGARATERAWYPSERPDFASCPALRAATQAALARAGLRTEDVDLIDFYSCFPVAVEMACEMLEIDEADPRGLTLTGGLPYFGGPTNNYTVHSLATAIERLRQGTGATALVTGNGWYLTKHSAVVLSREAADGPLEAPGPADVSSAPSPVEVAPEARGRATVETYTVLYARDGAPERGVVIGRLEEGRRFIANTPDDREALESFVAVENVGRSGNVRCQDGRNHFEPS